jgi:Protein of unknwon function (DUF3310)
MENSEWCENPECSDVSIHAHRACRPLGQVGGSHYRDLEHEPFDVIDEWSQTWPRETVFYFGNVLKYLARLGRKSSGMRDKDREDIMKALHYMEEGLRRFHD